MYVGDSRVPSDMELLEEKVFSFAKRGVGVVGGFGGLHYGIRGWRCFI